MGRAKHVRSSWKKIVLKIAFNIFPSNHACTIAAIFSSSVITVTILLLLLSSIAIRLASSYATIFRLRIWTYNQPFSRDCSRAYNKLCCAKRILVTSSPTTRAACFPSFLWGQNVPFTTVIYKNQNLLLTKISYLS